MREIRWIFPVLMVWATPCLAGLTTYTDQATWEAALPSFQTETFAISATGPLAPDTTHTLASLQFSYAGSNQDSFLPRVSDESFIGNIYKPIFGGGTSEPGAYTFSLPGDAYAVGADFSNASVLTLTAGADTVIVPAADQFNTPYFFGVISDQPFSSFVLDIQSDGDQINDQFRMDNVSYGPVPASAALLAIGGLAVICRRWSSRAVCLTTQVEKLS